MKRIFICACVVGLSISSFSCDLCKEDDGDGDGDGLYTLIHVPKACVAWEEDIGASQRNIHVKCRSGIGDWEQLGGALNVSENSDAYNASIALSRWGVVFVAWQEYDFDDMLSYVYVKQWDEDGGRWKLLGGALNVPVTAPTNIAGGAGEAPAVTISAWDPSLSVGKDDTIAAAFLQADSNIYVRRFSGDGWKTLGAPEYVVPDHVSNSYDLAVHEKDRIYLAWVNWDAGPGFNRIFTKRWNGDAWEVLGTYLNTSALTNAYPPSIALDDDGIPYVSFGQYFIVVSSIITRYWDRSQGEWVTVGEGITNIPYQSSRDLAVDLDGRPWVMWEENYLLYVNRWDGSTWKPVGDSVNTFDGSNYLNYMSGALSLVQPSVFYGAFPCATWSQEDASDIYQAWTSCFDGEAWMAPESLNIDQSHYAFMSDIAAQ